MRLDKIINKLKMTGNIIIDYNDFAILYHGISRKINVVLVNDKMKLHYLKADFIDFKINKYFLILQTRFGLTPAIFVANNFDNISRSFIDTDEILRITVIPSDNLNSSYSDNKQFRKLETGILVAVHDEYIRLLNYKGKIITINLKYKCDIHSMLYEKTEKGVCEIYWLNSFGHQIHKIRFNENLTVYAID